MIASMIRDLERWKGELNAAYPDIGGTLDGEIATLQSCLDGKGPGTPGPGMKEYRVKPYAGGVPSTVSASPNLVTYTATMLGLPGSTFTNHWQGCVTDTMATPVSDGEIVGVTFGHGQIAAYEIASGKRLWAWRDPQLSAAGASHCQSPLLWKDLLIVPGGGRSATAKKGDSDQYSQSLIGIDKRTGAIRWESSRGPGGGMPDGSHGEHMTPCLARLPDGKGGLRALVVGNLGAVLDAETGTKLGQFPQAVGATAETPAKNDYWGSGFVAYLDQRIYKGYGGDHSAPPINVWPIALGADGKLAIETGFKTKAQGASHNPMALSPKFLATDATLLDPATGETVFSWGKGPGGRPALTTNRIILMRGHGTRQAIFSIFDLTDPAKPVALNKIPNLIGDGTMPTDIADRYFLELKKPEFKRWCLGCYMGMRDGFGVDTSGVTLQGGRIFIKSQTHLYAIGEK
jgi:hypothetical protein